MRLAYLVLCHKNFEQLEMLVNSLDDGNADFFIHVDRKVSSFPVIQKDNVCYLQDEEREDIKWASFEMVQATMNLIEKCLNSYVPYDYIILLSGQDFPVKTNKDIQLFLSRGVGNNYIEVISDDDPMQKRYEKRNSLNYPHWMLNRSFIVKCIKRAYIYATGGYSYTIPLFRKQNKTGIKLYYGSQWWALTKECLEWIRYYIRSNLEIVKFFSSSLTPDESFFQTVFMASPYANRREDRIVFLEWDDNKNNPRIINKETAKKLLIADDRYLFARKFDEHVDAEALYLIVDCISNT